MYKSLMAFTMKLKLLYGTATKDRTKIKISNTPPMDPINCMIPKTYLK